MSSSSFTTWAQLGQPDNQNSSSNESNPNNSFTVRSGKTMTIAFDAITAVYLSIGSFGFTANVYVVFVIVMYKPMHRQLTNFLIANQSVIDASVAAFLFFDALYGDNGYTFTPGNISSEALCRLWYTHLPLWSMLVCSTCSIVALTTERYIAVVHPIWHKTTFSKSKMMIGVLVGFVWLIGPVFNAAYVIPTAGIMETGACAIYSIYPNILTQNAIGVIAIVIQFFIPLGLLGFCYTRMVLVIHRRVGTVYQMGDHALGLIEHGVSKEQVSGGGHGGGGGAVAAEEEVGVVKEVKKNESMARARTNVIKTLAMIAFFFVFCWSWNQISYLLYNFGYPINLTSNFYNFTVIMVFINCCVNPIVYSLNYKQFRQGVLIVICRKHPKPSHSTGNQL